HRSDHGGPLFSTPLNCRINAMAKLPDHIGGKRPRIHQGKRQPDLWWTATHPIPGGKRAEGKVPGLTVSFGVALNGRAESHQPGFRAARQNKEPESWTPGIGNLVWS